MKFILLLILLTNVNSWAMNSAVVGSWIRTYKVSPPYNGSSIGSPTALYDERLTLGDDEMAMISDTRSSARRQTIYTIVQRDGQNFIVFHTRDQNPNSEKIQQSQGYFFNTITDGNGQVRLTLQRVNSRNVIEYERIPSMEEPTFGIPFSAG